MSSKALNTPVQQGPSPLAAPEKYAERLEKKSPKQIVEKIVLCDFMLNIVEGEKDDPRYETAKAYHQAQRELLAAEIKRRKAAGIKLPPATVRAKTVVLGSKAGKSGG